MVIVTDYRGFRLEIVAVFVASPRARYRLNRAHV
jgi:hypothetical protein